MNLFWNILFDLGVLSFFGLLYYLWQRKRILRGDIAEILNFVGNEIQELNLYLDDKKNEPYYERINSFIESLEKVMENQDMHELNRVLEILPQGLPAEAIQDFLKLKEKLKIHIK